MQMIGVRGAGAVGAVQGCRVGARMESVERRTLFAAATETSASLLSEGGGGCSCGCSGGIRTAEQQVAFESARDAVPTLSETQFVHLSRTKSVESFWKPMKALPKESSRAVPVVHASAMAPFRIDLAGLRSKLRRAPMESTGLDGLALSLPNPGGGFSRFEVWESPILAAETSAKFKSIRTYSGQGLDDPTQVLRFDVTPQGLRATVLGSAESGGSYYIDPTFHRQTSSFVAYYRADAFVNPENAGFVCAAGMGEETPTEDDNTPSGTGGSSGGSGIEVMRSGTQLRTYRLAVATTGEYTAFHGGTVAQGLAAVTSVVNRLNTVYERDLSIRMTLVANTDQMIYTSAATDPFTSAANASTTNSQNQTNTDAIIGNANYDIGHVFHRGSNNGLAGGIGVVGRTGLKAQGYSSFSNPTGDPFTIDYVAHEMGHQFGGRHTFSNCDGGAGDTAARAVEPGSGSTIMAYAGICGGGTDLQSNSDAMFHSLNFDQILTYVDSTMPATGSRTPTGNTAPVVSAGGNRSIPTNTPYALTATATDVDGDSLTYSWEQRDGASGIAVNTTTSTTGPMVRAFLPSESPTRLVPRLPTLNGGPQAIGERLSTVARTMNFTVMVRDNRAGGGGVNTASMVLTIVNTGSAFAVTSPNTAVSWAAGSEQSITWNVAGTTANGINTANVRILLSSDGGLTYPVVLAESTPNDGVQSVTVPAGLTPTSAARVKVEAVGNLFFDISNVNFSITEPPVAAPLAPTLDSSSDTGVSDADRITRRNNASAGNALTFTIGNTVPGHTVRLFRAGTPVASIVATDTTTVISTAGAGVFPDGSNSFTAVQVSPANVSSAVSPATVVLIDTVGPVASYGISPLVRNAPVGELPINFAESVFGLSAGSFIIVRDSVTQFPPSLTLSGSGANYTLGDLTATTSPTADYSINLFSTATDAAGNLATGFLAFSHNVINLPTPPAGGNLVVVRQDPLLPGATEVFVNTTSSTPTYTWTFTPGQVLRIDGTSGLDRVRYEGAAIAGNVSVRMNLLGASTGTDELIVASGEFVADAPVGAATRVSVFSNAKVRFTATQTAGGLDLASGATAVLEADLALGSTPTLANNAAALGTRAYSAFLDLRDRSLVVRNGDLAGLRDMTRFWYTAASGLPGTAGLGSSLAFYGATTAFDTVGVYSNAGFPGSPTKSSFAGFSTTAADVLLGYTRLGDTDLSGTVDATDLARLLQGMQGTGNTLVGGGTGWNFGDIDYDGDTDNFDLGRLIAALRENA